MRLLRSVGVVRMASHLTDRQKKKIIADYVELGSYNATAKKNGVSRNTVKHIVMGDSESAIKCQQKKEQNTLDMLAYMESHKKQAQGVLDKYLTALANPDKIEAAKLSEVATAMGILMDKFINNPLKHEIDEQKLEIELLKLESQIKDNQPDEEAEDNFMEALNSTAETVWNDGGTDEN